MVPQTHPADGKSVNAWNSFLRVMDHGNFVWNAHARTDYPFRAVPFSVGTLPDEPAKKTMLPLETAEVVDYLSDVNSNSLLGMLGSGPLLPEGLQFSSVVKKRKRHMKHHKHRKLLKKTRHLRRKLGN